MPDRAGFADRNGGRQSYLPCKQRHDSPKSRPARNLTAIPCRRYADFRIALFRARIPHAMRALIGLCLIEHCDQAHGHSIIETKALMQESAFPHHTNDNAARYCANSRSISETHQTGAQGRTKNTRWMRWRELSPKARTPAILVRRTKSNQAAKVGKPTDSPSRMSSSTYRKRTGPRLRDRGSKKPTEKSAIRFRPVCCSRYEHTASLQRNGFGNPAAAIAASARSRFRGWYAKEADPGWPPRPCGANGAPAVPCDADRNRECFEPHQRLRSASG